MNWQLAVLLFVFFGAGVPILLGSLVSLLRNFRVVRNGSRTEGVIIEAEQGKRRQATVARRRAEGKTVTELRQPAFSVTPTKHIWTLMIEFDDTSGARHHAIVDAGTRQRPYEAGERIPIWFDPDEPSTVRIDSFAELWGWPILFVLFGATFVLFGVLLASGVLSVG